MNACKDLLFLVCTQYFFFFFRWWRW